jgi:hypothetical protein
VLIQYRVETRFRPIKDKYNHLFDVKRKWTRHGVKYKSPQQEILIMIKISRVRM